MKFSGILTVAAALMLSTGNVMAVPSGKTVEFASPAGKVTFSGKIHADKGFKCADCHSKPKLFEMKKGGDKISMAAINDGKSCGACHNGTKAFGAKAPASCVKCHEKNVATGFKTNVEAPVQLAAADTTTAGESTAATSTKESHGP